MYSVISDDELMSQYKLLDEEIKQESWDEFISYNQTDVIRVSELENKLGLISLALSLAYLTKCNIEDVFSPVKYWECYILSTLSYENTFCAIKRTGSSTGHLDGAYVMEPKIGSHEWIISIDGTALYPNFIRGLNMSPETIIGKNNDLNIDVFLKNEHTFLGAPFTIAANGAMFSNAVEGVMPRLVNKILTGRSIAKTAMLAAKQQYENTHDNQFKKIVDLQNTLQQAFKVAANSLFGICGNAGFIFFDHRIAEGITHTGQLVLKFIGNHINMRMNEFFKTGKHQYIIYGDTDSLYFSLGNIVEKHYKGKTDLQITAALDVLVEKYLRPYINEATDRISDMLNYYVKTLSFKREAISSSGFWCVHPSTNISTPNGDINIVDLFDSCDSIGDVREVNSIKCTSTSIDGSQIMDNITYVMRKHYIGDMYTITNVDGHQIKVTQDHQVMVLRDEFRIWVKAKDLKETDILITINRYINSKG